MAEKTKVTSVTDGDTFVCSGSVIYRLERVDMPERNRPRYEETKRYLYSLIYGKTVSVYVKAKDTYGRFVAQVRDGYKNINKLVKDKFG